MGEFLEAVRRASRVGLREFPEVVRRAWKAEREAAPARSCRAIRFCWWREEEAAEEEAARLSVPAAAKAATAALLPYVVWAVMERAQERAGARDAQAPVPAWTAPIQAPQVEPAAAAAVATKAHAGGTTT